MCSKVRVFAISDIHIDYEGNKQALLGLSATEFQKDVLIIAGDATDRMDRLEPFLAAMVEKFSSVLFVPGNHELWVKRSDHADSMSKFEEILALCDRIGVQTTPFRVGLENDPERVWLVPLLSWYHTQEHKEHTLYMEKKGVVDKTYDMWSDFFATKWPDEMAKDICGHFLNLNLEHLEKDYDAPVISVSHFLPRQELMLSTESERANSDLNFKDLYPEFNFSHVAGSKGIDQQLRRLGSRLHIYGHQHRNRHRVIDGVTYLSHCMGYPKERRAGVVAESCERPLEIWNTHEGFLL